MSIVDWTFPFRHIWHLLLSRNRDLSRKYALHIRAPQKPHFRFTQRTRSFRWCLRVTEQRNNQSPISCRSCNGASLIPLLHGSQELHAIDYVAKHVSDACLTAVAATFCAVQPKALICELISRIEGFRRAIEILAVNETSLAYFYCVAADVERKREVEKPLASCSLMSRDPSIPFRGPATVRCLGLCPHNTPEHNFEIAYQCKEAWSESCWHVLCYPKN